MRLNDGQTKKLLEYQGRIEIKQLTLSMTLSKFRRQYQEGTEVELVSKCTAELNLLFERFPAVMQPDYDWITRL